MSKKSGGIAARIDQFRGQDLDAHYLGYFDCFNRQLFYEAHDVLEELWLADRRGADGDFFKGLIQLAGAFVHVQKDRRRPAQALLDLARVNLKKYPLVHYRLETTEILQLIDHWWHRLEATSDAKSLLITNNPPQLSLKD